MLPDSSFKPSWSTSIGDVGFDNEAPNLSAVQNYHSTDNTMLFEDAYKMALAIDVSSMQYVVKSY